MEIRLDGNSAIVTGGSKGLGPGDRRGILRLRRRRRDPGARSRRPRRGEAADPGRAAAGRKVAAISCDVSKADAIKQACDQVISEFGKVDIFVNNAGQSTRGPSETITDEMWQADLDLKLFAQVRFCRLLMPQMKERKLGPHHQRPQHRRQGARGRQRADLGQPRRADGLDQGACRWKGRRTTCWSIRCMSASSSATRSCAATSASGPMSRSRSSSRRPAAPCRWGGWAGPRNSPVSRRFMASDAASYVTGCADQRRWRPLAGLCDAAANRH